MKCWTSLSSCQWQISWGKVLWDGTLRQRLQQVHRRSKSRTPRSLQALYRLPSKVSQPVSIAKTILIYSNDDPYLWSPIGLCLSEPCWFPVPASGCLLWTLPGDVAWKLCSNVARLSNCNGEYGVPGTLFLNIPFCICHSCSDVLSSFTGYVSIVYSSSPHMLLDLSGLRYSKQAQKLNGKPPTFWGLSQWKNLFWMVI